MLFNRVLATAAGEEAGEIAAAHCFFYVLQHVMRLGVCTSHCRVTH
jgi:hypothetical protein